MARRALGVLTAFWLAVPLFSGTAAAQDIAQPEMSVGTLSAATHEPTAEASTVPPTATLAPQSAPAAVPAVPTMNPPRITFFAANWNAAREAAAAIDPTPATGDNAEPPAADVLARLNTLTERIFPKIATSVAPVLLPFDVGGYRRDQPDGNTGDIAKYFSGFHAPTLFYPGPSGYDAVFALEPQDIPGLGLAFARRLDVQITASTVLDELDGATLDPGMPVRELENDFPGIRRFLVESRVRYVFERFGVPYIVSIACIDGPKSARYLACREADQIAVRFVKALHLVGGMPSGDASNAAVATIDRPEETSSDFTYYPAGDILPGTGMNGRSGRPDTTVYAKMRFPMEKAPAYVNSQSFMNWGNCDLTGRVSLGGRGKETSYRCRVNQVPLFNDETRNYAYPWRDNFCEHRYYDVAQCPAGLGHQGEDIRPSSCKLRNEDADRCEPYQDQVVAARDGVVWREFGDEALYLTADAPGEHVRFRYLHMNPHMLDAAGLVSGRVLAEGDLLGPVGDYGHREGGTSYHLHFDLQVLTRQGWVFVNPYTTLVAAYERLIGAKGQIVAPQVVSPEASKPSAANAMSEPAGGDGVSKSESKSEGEQQGGHRAVVEHCKTRFVRGHRRRVCWNDAAAIGGSEVRTVAVRRMDRGVPLQGGSTRHRAGDLRQRHAGNRARHDRA
jgi:hypothetical protein